ncbi:unnamed protein product [Didymodactylos carnosus]|uniref:Uncharacterized protein n=1 Tax=Didymodactylos carnosus TaxID=1234261 RepID=A0A8S2FSS5_9BILA|nr:unnamed protein product [Didymodactylos carnosus]CAF4325146.1 unnamed protein product [Didymodactylos carnosus]
MFITTGIKREKFINRADWSHSTKLAEDLRNKSFVYRILNKATHEQNIYMIFLYHCFIRFIHIQLKDEQKDIYEHNLRLYRGQTMSTNELNNLKLGTFLST